MAWQELEEEQEGRRRQSWMSDYRMAKHADVKEFKQYYDMLMRKEE